MATLASNFPTYVDVAKRTDPDGKTARIVEMLAQSNEILDDAVVLECNDGTSHKTTMRTGLPQGTWRRLYQGVQPEKSTTVQVADTCGMLQTYAQVDKKLIELAPDPAGFRLSEERPFMEGLTQTIAKTLFYGNQATETEKFTGLSARYNTVNTATAQTANNVVDAGGVGSDNTSIWLVVWGENTAHMLYPKGSKAGIQQEDKGQQTQVNADGSMYEVYRTLWTWDAGLSVRDWRYVVRIANIDVSDIRSDTTKMKALISNMIDAEEKIPSLGMGRAAWYCNRTVRAALRKGILEKVAYNLTEETVSGKRVTMFDGIPVRICDQLINAEARVV